MRPPTLHHRRMMMSNNQPAPQNLDETLPNFFVPFDDAGAGVVSMTDVSSGATPTFTRATTAWTRLASGLWTSVASGSPRSYYDSNGIYRGYFTENAARTNRCLQSRDLTNAAWTASNVTPLKTSVGIDGAANSCSSLTATAGNGTLLQAITNASAARTFSCWMKRVVGTGAISLTLDNGSTWTDISSLINSSTFTLVQIQQTLANPTVGFKITTLADSVIIDMCQEETGAMASSPIPTTAAAVTRNADVLTYPIGNIGVLVGSAYLDVHIALPPIGATQTFVGGTGGAGFAAQLTTTPTARNSDGTASLATAALTVSTMYKIASAWGGSTKQVVANGGAAASGAFDGDMSMTTALAIGSAAFCAIRNVKIFNRQLSPSELQALTQA